MAELFQELVLDREDLISSPEIGLFEDVVLVKLLLVDGGVRNEHLVDGRNEDFGLLLQLLNQKLFICFHETNIDTRVFVASTSPGPVNKGLSIYWDVELNHVVHFVYIKPSGSQVGADDAPDGPDSEQVQHDFPSLLGEVREENRSNFPEFLQILELLDFLNSVDEDDDLGLRLLVEDLHDGLDHLFYLHFPALALDVEVPNRGREEFFVLSNQVDQRELLFEEIVGQSLDEFWDSRGKERNLDLLFVLLDLVHDFTDFSLVPEFQGHVHLVHNQIFQFVQLDGSALEKHVQSPGSGNDDVYSFENGFTLESHGDSSVDSQQPEFMVEIHQRLEEAFNLPREFPHGHDDQDLGQFVLEPSTLSDSFENRKSERHSLPRTSLALGDQIFTLENGFKARALDRKHVDEIVFLQGNQGECADLGEV